MCVVLQNFPRIINIDYEFNKLPFLVVAAASILVVVQNRSFYAARRTERGVTRR